MKHIRGALLCCLSMVLLAACGGGGGSSAPPVVTVTPAMANVMVGQQIQLAATTTDAKGNVLTGPVTWVTGNPSVATVNATGLVMALTLGQVTISATSEGQNGAAALTTTTGIVFAAVSAGDTHTCGVTPSGAAYCWGNNNSGQLGNGTMVNSATPVPVSGALNFAMISAGGNHTCGLTSGGVAYCWGDNTFGQLGNASTTNNAVPVAVIGGLQFDTLSAGTGHTCGTNGTLYCWGNNSSGQLGNGTLTNSTVPVTGTGLGNWNSVSAGSNHTCGIIRAGPFGSFALYFCWGDNSSGQLGNGTTTSSAVPVQFATSGAAVYTLSAGTLYTCAAGGPVMSANGTLSSCWGNNSVGQLGNGSLTNSAIPVAVLGGLILPPVSAGAVHACAPSLSANGLAFSGTYCWGGNSSGQLGDGTTTPSSMPIVVTGNLAFASVSAGGLHTCGVISDSPPTPLPAPKPGAVYCWGDNTYGQLGNRWTTTSSIPVNVAGSP
jgi:alpha-tubulin suppressor-like RCC1 family protein